MQTSTLAVLLTLLVWHIDAQHDLPYEPNADHPYGLANQAVGDQINDWEPLIGISHCQSVQRNPDGTWQDTIQMVWTWKYILNGTAVQDISLKAGKLYSTSIRQFHPDSNQWMVTYFSYPGVSAAPGTWRGGKMGDEIVLNQPQKAPNGMDGNSRLTFYDMTPSGFSWKGEWVKDDASITYPFWTIKCTKVTTDE